MSLPINFYTVFAIILATLFLMALCGWVTAIICEDKYKRDIATCLKIINEKKDKIESTVRVARETIRETIECANQNIKAVSNLRLKNQLDIVEAIWESRTIDREQRDILKWIAEAKSPAPEQDFVTAATTFADRIDYIAKAKIPITCEVYDLFVSTAERIREIVSLIRSKKF